LTKLVISQLFVACLAFSYGVILYGIHVMLVTVVVIITFTNDSAELVMTDMARVGISRNTHSTVLCLGLPRQAVKKHGMPHSITVCVPALGTCLSARQKWSCWGRVWEGLPPPTVWFKHGISPPDKFWNI